MFKEIEGDREEATPRKTTQDHSELEERASRVRRQRVLESKGRAWEPAISLGNVITFAKAAQQTGGNRSSVTGGERSLVRKFYLVIDSSNEGNNRDRHHLQAGLSKGSQSNRTFGK